MRWLTASTRVGVTSTGRYMAAALLDHYKETLTEMQQIGYLEYARRQFSPYLRAAVGQFSPRRRTLTERALDKIRSMRRGSPENGKSDADSV
jgi:hypothetical protein